MMHVSFFGKVKTLGWCATQQNIHVTLTEAVSPTQLPLCHCTGHSWPLTPRIHGMPAKGKCAHLPSFVCGPASNPHWTILLCPYQAKGHWPFASERWSRECLCGQSQWRVSERALRVVAAKRGKEERIRELPSVFGS